MKAYGHNRHKMIVARTINVMIPKYTNDSLVLFVMASSQFGAGRVIAFLV